MSEVADLRLAAAEKGKKEKASRTETFKGGGGGSSADEASTRPASEHDSSEADAFSLRTPPHMRTDASKAPASIIAAKIKESYAPTDISTAVEEHLLSSKSGQPESPRSRKQRTHGGSGPHYSHQIHGHL